MATRRTHTRSDGQRRARFWAREQTAIVPIATASAVELLGDFRTQLGVTSNPPGLTIGGVLLDLTVTQTSALAAEGDGIVFGLLVSSEELASDVDGPIDNPHADWMWYQYIGSPGAADGASWTTFQSLGGPIRIRAKRRMDEIGMNFWLAAQTTGTTSFDLTISASTLLLLP